MEWFWTPQNRLTVLICNKGQSLTEESVYTKVFGITFGQDVRIDYERLISRTWRRKQRSLETNQHGFKKSQVR